MAAVVSVVPAPAPVIDPGHVQAIGLADPLIYGNQYFVLLGAGRGGLTVEAASASVAAQFPTGAYVYLAQGVIVMRGEVSVSGLRYVTPALQGTWPVGVRLQISISTAGNAGNYLWSEDEGQVVVPKKVVYGALAGGPRSVAARFVARKSVR